MDEHTLTELGLTAREAQLVAGALAAHFLPTIDADGFADLDDGPWFLLERGHYGRTWISAHETPDSASDYALGQECAEDWEPTVLLHRETGQQLTPGRIEWR